MGSSKHAFTQVKTFSAQLARERDGLGEVVTQWLAGHPELAVVDKAVTQSSDKEFHCLTITLFLAPRASQKTSPGAERDDD